VSDLAPVWNLVLGIWDFTNRVVAESRTSI
jgi:hypothetical protein